MKCFRTLNLRVLGLSAIALVMSCQPEKPAVISPNLDLTDNGLIRNWYNLSLELGPKCNGYYEPVMARALSYFSILMHESLYRGIPDARSLKSSTDGFKFNLPEPDISTEYNWAIVANEAAMVYFENIFGSATNFSQRTNKLYSDQLLKYSSGIDSAILADSKFYGRQLVFALLKYAEEDGFALAYLDPFYSAYQIPTGEGKWIPSTPDYTARPLLPHWGNCKPVLRSNVENIKLNKELTYSNQSKSIMYSEAVEVRNLGIAITETQKDDASYFSRNMGYSSQPLYHVYSLALQLMYQNQLDLPKSLDLMNKLSYALHDGYIASYKYIYSKNLLRASTYIKQLIDRYYQPEYPSMPLPEGLSDKSMCYAVGAEILSNYFGYRQSFTDNTQIERPDLRNKSRSFDSFQQFSIEASEGEIYTGVHFRTSIEAGRKLGTDIARNTINFIQN
ncbi:MAG: hypothetical protein HOP11_08335 [Saprospiraceae bacterium]|nr:hypothetical protein [Saprospiraceae bacterium]